MTRSTLLGAPTRDSLRWQIAVLALVMVAAANTTAAQSPPPVQGTIALEGTMEKFYKGTNVVVVATIDGVEHVYHFAKDLIVHGGKGTGTDALEGLRDGTTVVVHYTVQGAGPAAQEVDVIGGGGLEATEGVVTQVDRGRKQITVRYDNGRTETFLLTERAVAETTQIMQTAPGETKVLIYYLDEHGQKVAHFFKRMPE